MLIAKIHDAKTNLSRLIAAAERGEEVVISRAGKPVARLVAYGAQPGEPSAADRLQRAFGAWQGLVSIPSDEEWAEMDRDIQADFDTAIDKPWP